MCTVFDYIENLRMVSLEFKGINPLEFKDGIRTLPFCLLGQLSQNNSLSVILTAHKRPS